ncbi:MAG: ABC transporter substrate-binding protein [bacterium]
MFTRKFEPSKTHKFIFLLIGMLTTTFILFECTKSQKVYRIGVLCGLNFFANTVDGLKSKMEKLGYVEGENIIYDYKESQSNIDSARQILKKFVDDKVDLIFVLPTNVSVEAKKITRDTNIPVVFANANVEGQNLINSISSPGENITGVRYPGPDLTIKRFEIMMEIAPAIKRVWVPYKRGLNIVPGQLELLRKATQLENVTLIESPADDADEIQSIITGFEKSAEVGIDAILMIAEPLAVTPNTFLIMAKFAAVHKILMGGALMTVEGYSSVFGISTDNVSVGEQAALLVHKVLTGTPPGTIPVISAENNLQISYEAADRIGIKIPDGILKQANKIIQK